MNQLIKRSKIVNCITVAAGAAGTTSLNGAVIDFQSMEGALIIIALGPIVSGGVQTVKFQHGDASDLSDAADVAGTSQTIADTDDNTLVYIDIRKPTKRYGRIVFARATQNATVTAVAVVYGSRDCPTTQASGVVGEVFNNAIAGTA